MISIIDDDASVREATAKTHPLARLPRREIFIGRGIFAVGPQRNSSCLITDLNMPGMSGADLQDRLIAEGHRTPMIFMTAYFEEKVRDRVLDAGASGFLRKPFDEKSLIACLDKALESNTGDRG